MKLQFGSGRAHWHPAAELILQCRSKSFGYCPGVGNGFRLGEYSSMLSFIFAFHGKWVLMKAMRVV